MVIGALLHRPFAAVLTLVAAALALVQGAPPAAAADGGIARLEAADVALPQRSGAKTKDVFPGERTLLQGLTYYDTKKCEVIDTGSTSASVEPQFGDLEILVEPHPLASGPCAGTVMPFSVAYYTWTSTDPADTRDLTFLDWRSSETGLTDSTFWTIERGPKILMSGKDVSGKTVQVVGGQFIELTVSPAVKSARWTLTGRRNGGYTPTPAAPANPRVLPVKTDRTTLEVYLLGPGKQTVTVKVVTPKGNTATSQVTFNTKLPKPVAATAKLGKVIVKPPDTVSFGDLQNRKPGILMNSAGTGQPGPGEIVWVQILVSDKRLMTDRSNRKFDCAYKPGLDNDYPYSTGPTTDDSPLMTTSKYKVADVAMNFRMYMMWQSSLAKSIPVPLGYFDWSVGWKSDRKTKTGVWRLVSSARAASPFTRSTAYPTWSRVLGNGELKCRPVN